MKKFIIIAVSIFLSMQFFVPDAQSLKIGTTYSPKQSEYLGIDWKETYLKILDAGFDLIRLGAYWNDIEKEEDIFNFSILDWQVKQATIKGIPVILTVGMKAPRWPEFFIPEWVNEKAKFSYGSNIAKSKYLQERTVKFIRKVVNHYKDEAIIQYWQVENEALDRMGPKFWFIDEDFLKQEIETVRSLDPEKRPIVLTAATYPNKTLRFMMRLTKPYNALKRCTEMGDIIGLNVYLGIGQQFWGQDFYFWSHRAERAAYFAKIIDYIKDRRKKVWITELQAEPWEPGQLVYKKKKCPPTGWPVKTKESFQEFAQMGVDAILLWGAEYWCFREERYKDTKWWEMVFKILKEQGSFMDKGKRGPAGKQ